MKITVVSKRVTKQSEGWGEMARPNKIEQLNVHHIVARCLSEGITSVRKIAAACTKAVKDQGIKDEVSPTAVHRYIEAIKYQKPAPTEQKKAAVTKVPGRVEKIVNFDIDIIELQYRTTSALLERFEFVTQLPEMFERRMDEVIDQLKVETETDPEYLYRWKIAFVEDLKRNVQNVTSLNRELRENSKFMADLREKAFQFSLMKEFTDLFIEQFRKESPEACDRALAHISANPRMQRIVEQQVRGEMA